MKMWKFNNTIIVIQSVNQLSFFEKAVLVITIRFDFPRCYQHHRRHKNDVKELIAGQKSVSVADRIISQPFSHLSRARLLLLLTRRQIYDTG